MGAGTSCSFSAAKAAVEPVLGGGFDGVRYDEPLTLFSPPAFLPAPNAAVVVAELGPALSRNVVRDEDLLIPLAAPTPVEEAVAAADRLDDDDDAAVAALFGRLSREVTISSRKSSTDCASSPEPATPPTPAVAAEDEALELPIVLDGRDREGPLDEAPPLATALPSAFGSPSKLSRLSRNCRTSSRCDRVLPLAPAPAVRVEGVLGRDIDSAETKLQAVFSNSVHNIMTHAYCTSSTTVHHAN